MKDLERRESCGYLGVFTAGEYNEKAVSKSTDDDSVTGFCSVFHRPLLANGFGGVLVVSILRLKVGVYLDAMLYV